jgi:two-component system, OmpR family, response regulator
MPIAQSRANRANWSPRCVRCCVAAGRWSMTGLNTGGWWQLNLIDRSLRAADGTSVELSTSEFGLLRSFTDMPRRVLTRELLLDTTYGSGVDVFDRAIDVQVSRLRRKFGADGANLIRTVRNEGYMFTMAVVRR